MEAGRVSGRRLAATFRTKEGKMKKKGRMDDNME